MESLCQHPTLHGTLALYATYVRHHSVNIPRSVGCSPHSQQRGDEGDKRWHTLSQRPTHTLPSRPTHGQPIGGEERDAGQEREKAEIGNQRSPNGLITAHPDGDAPDETACNEQVCRNRR
jgi:hypothetical protein